ncbi:MAG: alpha/beta fold hydrolase [Thermoanaerobaculia bacterium]
MREQRVEIPPHSFWIRTAGSGTPVVLLHGLSGSSHWWDRNVDALSERHRVIAPDMVGFGRNRRFVGSPLPLSFDEGVALLVRWLESELSEPVHLVGHSMGGQTAIELAARAPSMVRSLTLIASTGVPLISIARPHLEALVHPPRELITFGPRLVLDALRAGPGSIALASARMLLRDSRPAMETIRAPVLLVWGESDPLVPVQYAEAMRERMPQARLAILAGAGHVAMWDQPREFERTLLRFLDEVESAHEPPSPPEKPPFSWAVRDCRGGICWRSSGGAADVVLIHGLGLGSGYLRRLAASLHARGLGAVAPDLPGIGFSRDEESEIGNMSDLVQRTLGWAEDAGIEGAVWAGHSTGCVLVDGVKKSGSSAIRTAVHIAPIWTRRSWPWIRLPLLLAVDGTREPWALFAEAISAYWDSGLLPIVAHARAAREALAEVPADALFLGGARDPMIDRPRLRELGAELELVPGAHGVAFSNPDAVAEEIARLT